MESACRAQFDLFERAVPLSLVSQQSSFLAAADPPPSNVSDHGHRAHRPCPCLSRLFARLAIEILLLSAPSFLFLDLISQLFSVIYLWFNDVVMRALSAIPTLYTSLRHCVYIYVGINSFFCQIKIISHFIIARFIIPRMFFFFLFLFSLFCNIALKG